MASWSRRHPNLGSPTLPDVGRAMAQLDQLLRNLPSSWLGTSWLGEGCKVRAREGPTVSTSRWEHCPCAGLNPQCLGPGVRQSVDQWFSNF